MLRVSHLEHVNVVGEPGGIAIEVLKHMITKVQPFSEWCI